MSEPTPTETPEPTSPPTSPPTRRAWPAWLRIVLSLSPLLVLFAVGVFVVPIVKNMLIPPRPIPVARPASQANPPSTPPRPNAVAPTVAPNRARAPAADDPALIAAYGTGALSLARRDARRMGETAADALACGLRDQRWVNDFREAFGPTLARRHHSHEGLATDATQLTRFATAQFADAAATRPQPPSSTCAELPVMPDFRAGDSLVRAHRTPAPR